MKKPSQKTSNNLLKTSPETPEVVFGPAIPADPRRSVAAGLNRLPSMSKTPAPDRKTALSILSALCDQAIEDAAKADAANDEAAFKEACKRLAKIREVAQLLHGA